MPANKKTLIDGDFQVGSNHLTVDTSNNYVGFNTATPQNKIDVQIGARTGTHSTDKPLYVTGVTGTSGAEFVSDDGTAGIGIGSSNIFTTETNQNLTIAPDGTGAVGIKTATPNPSGETFDLWVQGDTKVTGNVTAGTFFGDGSGLTNIISSQWDSSLEDIYFLNNSGSGSGRVAIGTTTPVSLLTLEGASGGAPPTTGQEGTSNALVRVRDDNNVTLDIGTSSGTSWLQSSDATAMGTDYSISINPNGGNVGVGTISPGAPLEVNKSSGGEILRLTTSTGTLYAGADADPPWFGTSSDDHLRLMTNGTEKIRIESGGNVGVNTIAPLANLHVTGNTYVTSDLRVGSEIVMDEKVATFGTTKTFTVTVSGSVYYIDGVQQPSLELHERQTYIFDMSDSTNSGHPLAFSTAYNGATSSYTTGVVSNHSTVPSGTTGSKVTFTVPVGAPSAFYYYCTVHGASMGSSTASSIASTAELIVSGRVVASGNVEASNFIGGGTELTGVALEADLVSNVTRIANLEAANTVQGNLITALDAANTVQGGLITSLTTDMTSNALRVTNIENNVLVSNSSGITTGFTRGDIIYASADNTLNKLPLGTANQVLKSDGTDVVWGTDGGASASTVWLENGNKIYYNTDNVGIGTSTPAFKLDVHGTANVGALTATTLSVGGAAVALDADMTSNAALIDALYTATTGDIIVATGTDTLGKLGIGSSGQVLKVASSGTSLEWTSDLTGGGSGGGQWTGTTEIYFEGNVGISNTDPGHDLSVGSNLYVDDDGSNVLVIDGNLTAESMTLGGIGIVPSYPLSSVTDTGNTTPHTIEFTNAETGIVVDSNIVVAGNVTAAFLYGDASNVTGIASNLHQIVENGNVTSNTVQFSNATTGLVTTANVEVGGELTVSGNVAVDTDTLVVDSVNNRVGVGTTTPLETLDVYGGFLVRPERATTTYPNAWDRSDGNFYYNNTPQSGSDIDVIYSKNAIYTTTGGLKVSSPSNDSEFYYRMEPDVFQPGLYFPLSVSITSPYLSGDVFSSTRFKADNTEDFTGFAIGQDYEAGDTLNDYSQSLDIARAHSAHMYFKTASPDGSLTEKMRITNAGNVGIGTTNPSAKLHVTNQVNSTGTGDAYLDGVSGVVSKPTECLRLQGKYHDQGSGALLRFTNQHNSGTNPNTGEYNLAGIAGYDHDNSWGGGLAFYTSPGGGSGGDDLKLRMNIDSVGGVNIPGPTTGASHGSASMLYLLDTPLIKEWQWTGSTNNTLRVTFSASELPAGCKAIYADVFMPQHSANDHVGHALGKNHGQQTMWTSGRNVQPSASFGNLALQQCFLAMPGQTDGFEYYYGNWWNSLIIPLDTQNRLYHTVSGESGSTQSWIYMVVKGYFH